MTFEWYKLLNIAEFEATELVSRKLTVELEGIGEAEILVTKGFKYSVLYDGVFLSVGLSDQNPFEFEGYAAAIDAAGDLYLGFEVDED